MYELHVQDSECYEADSTSEYVQPIALDNEDDSPTKLSGPNPNSVPNTPLHNTTGTTSVEAVPSATSTTSVAATVDSEVSFGSFGLGDGQEQEQQFHQHQKQQQEEGLNWDKSLFPVSDFKEFCKDFYFVSELKHYDDALFAVKS